MKEPRFTQNMLNHAYDDNGAIRACKLPSALVEVPKINEKYETKSFAQSDINGRDLKTLQLFENSKKDPILNINAAFFGKKENEQPNKLRDPYEEIYNRQR